jgi:hypothetical protein
MPMMARDPEMAEVSWRRRLKIGFLEIVIC